MDPGSMYSQSLPQPATSLETREHHILIADDQAAIRQTLRIWLEQERYHVIEARSGEEAIALLTRQDAPQIDLILLDYDLLDMLATDVQQAMLAQGVEIPVVVISALGRARSVIQTIKLGALDYLYKPFRDSSVVLDIVRQGLDQRHRTLTGTLAEIPEADPSELLIGEDPTMIAVLKQVGHIGRLNSFVTITGEPGVGKTLLAEAIHQASDRRRGPFVKVNITEIPPELLEAKLFGIMKGAYTGAPKDEAGIFELANKGTLFLDEIGELTPKTQTNLLGILQKKQIVQRLGSNKPVEVDVRVIVATNRDLAREVREHRYREDLYDRLNEETIHMPPLRDHKRDIPGLVAHFLEMYRLSPGAPPARITTEALQKLLDYSWPGNVRELEQCIKRAVTASRGDVILPEFITFLHDSTWPRMDIADLVRQGSPVRDIVQETIAMAARTALGMTDNHAGRAAQLLRISPRTFETLRAAFDI